jgi:hypothetical protein
MTTPFLDTMVVSKLQNISYVIIGGQVFTMTSRHMLMDVKLANKQNLIEFQLKCPSTLSTHHRDLGKSLLSTSLAHFLNVKDIM